MTVRRTPKRTAIGGPGLERRTKMAPKVTTKTKDCTDQKTLHLGPLGSQTKLGCAYAKS